MATKKSALGRGLTSLLSVESIPGNEARTVLELSIHDVSPNLDQPRKYFDEEALSDLSASIKEHGLIQPIIVTKKGNGYQIVAGERRWRAARQAKLKTIPAIVRDLEEHQILQQALIENLQRQNLNAIEEAQALRRLMDEHQMTQEMLSKTIGKSRPALANALRLLNLPKSLQDRVVKGDLTAGHARTLLGVEDEDQQAQLAKRVVEEGLNVRQLEALVQSKPIRVKKKKEKDEAYELNLKSVEDRLQSALSAKVKLREKKNKGSITIEYYSADERERLIDLLLEQGKSNVK